MDNLSDLIVVKVDSLLSMGSMLNLVDIEVSKGEVEVLDNGCISQLDVIVGNYPLRRWDSSRSRVAIEGTEPFILKIGEMLLQEELVTMDEVYDIRSILSVLSGASGYERTRAVIKTLQDYELNMLVNWMYALSILQLNSTSDLSVGIKALAGEYRESLDMQVKVKDVVEAYTLEHSYLGERLIDIDVTVIPCWWWIQNLRESRKSTYNYILKKDA